MKWRLCSTECITSRKFLNCLAASAAGLLYFGGWWLLFDVHAAYPDVMSKCPYYYVPGIFNSIAFFVVNAIPTDMINGNAYGYSGRCTVFCARLFTFLGFFLLFGSLIGASFIFVHEFLMQPEKFQWPGLGIFLQNLFIVIATFVFKFAIIKDDVIY